MKNLRKFTAITLRAVMIMAFSACVKKPAEDYTEENSGYEKFLRLTTGMKEENVEKILGKPDSTDGMYRNYTVRINGGDCPVEVLIKNGVVAVYNGDFDDERYRPWFVRPQTDFGEANQLGQELDSYRRVAQAFGTEGYLIGVGGKNIEKYMWVKSDDEYITVTFGPDGVMEYTGHY